MSTDYSLLFTIWNYLFIYFFIPLRQYYMYMKQQNIKYTRAQRKGKNTVWQGQHNSFRQLLWARSLKINL